MALHEGQYFSNPPHFTFGDCGVNNEKPRYLCTHVTCERIPREGVLPYIGYTGTAADQGILMLTSTPEQGILSKLQLPRHGLPDAQKRSCV